MDENSCKNETSVSVDDQKAKKSINAPRLEVVGVKVAASNPQVMDRCEPSIHSSGSGPSTNFSFVKNNDNSVETESAETSEVTTAGCETTGSSIPVEECSEMAKEDNENPTGLSTPPSYDPEARVEPEVSQQQRKLSVGPPPSYSFVMKQKKKVKSVPSPDPLVINRLPPPTYSGSRRLYMPPDDRTCTLPSFAEPIWRSHSQPALCPRCGIIVITTTHAHDSIATHVAALALCLFGCWPCCLLPYCMNLCKNTYHHCPICQTFLGLYRPW